MNLGRHSLVTVAALVVSVFTIVGLCTRINVGSGLLFVTGLLLGATLAGSSFSFSRPWRKFATNREGGEFRVQIFLIVVGICLFAPLLGRGVVFGHPVAALAAPIGVPIAIGAFLYGIGMQLTGGCSCGALFGAAGLDARTIITLASLIVGSVLATASFGWWLPMPALPPISLFKEFGPFDGAIISISALLLIFAISVAADANFSLPRSTQELGLQLRHVFKLVPREEVWVVLALGLLNVVVLSVAGRPWNITPAFALWGAKIAELLGFHPIDWTYWGFAENAKALRSSVFSDATSNMDMGIFLGALVVLSSRSRLKTNFRITWGEAASASVGGLLLGYGARIAFGGTAGALYSGIASGSLHAWVWAVSAFAGSTLTVRLLEGGAKR